MKLKLNYIVIPLLVFGVLFIGKLLTVPGLAWYHTLKLPAVVPADWVFGAVWSGLGLLIVLALYRLWNKTVRDDFFGVINFLFIIAAGLQIAWSYLFFDQHKIMLAIGCAALLALIAFLLVLFVWPRSKFAAILLLPYFAWLCFATYLTYSIWAINHPISKTFLDYYLRT